MADQLRAGMQYLADRLKETQSQPATYRRGNDSVVLQVTFAGQLLQVWDAAGKAKIERADRDFTFPAADLILGGLLRTPQRGDFVDVVFGAATYRFEVMPIESERAWRYADTHNIRIRVHTKFKATV